MTLRAMQKGAVTLLQLARQMYVKDCELEEQRH
jgi:hypothetical protein